PPLASLSALPHNLPQQVTSFIGREREMAEVKALLTSVEGVQASGRSGVQEETDFIAASRAAVPVGPDDLNAGTPERRNARLVTVTGVGGTGKTRLALQLAAELLEGVEDGVWLVELAALSDPAQVPQAVATVLGVREEPGKALAVTVAERLREKRLL